MIVATMPVRNEAWCIGLTLRALLMWVDKVVVLNHASTDETGAILHKINQEDPGRLIVLEESAVVWEEMRHRQLMLDTARGLDADHIVLVDADEILTGPIGEIKELVRMIPPGFIYQLPWICLDSPERYYSTGMWSEQLITFAFKNDPRCYWAARNGYDFHHREPMGIEWRSFPIRNRGGLMHLQFMNKRRLKAKQYLYQLTERLRWPDRESVSQVRRRYSMTVEAALKAETAPVPARWWEPYQHLMQHLHLNENAVPWQETVCKRLLQEHPGINHGLDDFGLNLAN